MSKPNMNFRKKPLISVIIPAYNVENTIEKCLKSLLNQIFEDFELVVINDCSTDNTSVIIEQIMKIDNRLVFIELKVNHGLGPVRNIGVSAARGEYVAFVDGDDSVEPDYLLTLFNLMKENDADVCQVGIRYIWEDRDYSHEIIPGVIEGDVCRYRIDSFDGRVSLTPQAWNKLYKKTLFFNDGAVEFKNIVYEDAEILPRLLSKAKKVVVSNEPLYNYYKMNSLITSDSAIVKQFDKYLDSLGKTLVPYIEDDYLEGLNKYNFAFPKTYLANTGNFLRSLASYYCSATKNEKKKVVDRLISYLIQNREIFLKIPVNPLIWFDLYYNFSKQIGVHRYFIVNYKQLLRIKNAIELVEFKKRKRIKIQKKAATAFEKMIPILDKIVPKNKSVYLFTTWSKYPHTIDNPRSVFEMVKNNREIKKVIMMNGDEAYNHIDSGINTEFVFLHSIKGLIYILRSKNIFTGYSLHNIFGYRRILNRKNRNVIQLWHGIPIKKIGLSCKTEKHWKEEVKNYKFIPSSSETDKKTMARAFFPNNPEKIIVTGLPRHDLLCLPETKLPLDYQQDIKCLRKRANNKKFILLAPTWRSNGKAPLEFSVEQINEIKALLLKNNCVMGVRAHYNVRFGKKAFISDYVSDIFFPVEDIPDVNVILRETLLLITDYSSLYLDFMKLNRPVILYTPDLSSYERGLFYDSNEFVPHNICDDFKKFLGELEEKLCNNIIGDKKYNEVKNRFHSFSNEPSFAKRVIDNLN